MAEDSVIESWFKARPPPTPTTVGPLTWASVLSPDSSLARISLAAGALGLACTLSAPLERAKLLMQTQTEMHVQRPYTSAVETLRRVATAEGVQSLWRGNGTAVFRCVTIVGLHRVLKDVYFPMVDTAVPQSTSGHIGHTLSIGLATGTTLLIMHPFEFVRTRVAVDAHQFVRNPFTVISRTYLDRGLLKGGLYSGFVPSVLNLATYCGISLGMYKTIAFLSGAEEDDVQVAFLAGGVSTVCAHVAAYPFDTLRRRMMVLGRDIYDFGGGANYLQAVLHDGGIRGLYRGLAVTAAHHALFGGVMFACFASFPASAVAY